MSWRSPYGSPQVAWFGLPAVGRKPVVAAFDGGRITSDGGVLLLAPVERKLGIAGALAQLIADPRNPAYVTHSVSGILRARILAIACGYEDADDFDVCAPTRRSSWPAAGCLTAAAICARSRPCRAGRTRPPCARWCA